MLTRRGGAMELGVLGPLVVLRHGRPVHISGVKVRALLVCLILRRDQVVAVDRLADDIWDGSPPPAAAATLHAHVSRLRKVLDPGVVRTCKPGYQLVLPEQAVDAARFDALADRARQAGRSGDLDAAATLWRQALALWRGPALQEFADTGFARSEVLRLDELRLQAVEERIAVDLRRGRSSDVVSELEGLVAEHGLREGLCAQLMLALYRCGRQAEALDVYRAARHRLLSEVGVPPGPALVELQAAVLRQDPSLRPEQPVRRGPQARDHSVTVRPCARVLAPQSGPAPLLGRQDSLTCLQEALAGEPPRPRVVLLTGEPGVGKTRLAQTLGVQVQAAGGVVLWGRAVRESHTPYEPVLDALREYIPRLPPDQRPLIVGAGGALLASLVPGLVSSYVVHSHRAPEFERLLFFEAVAEVLHDAGTRGRALLVLDDLQWADSSTATLLSHLASHPAGDRLLVVGIHREAEWQAEHPVARVLHSLRAEGALVHLPLRGLDVNAVQKLVATVAGRPCPPSLGLALHEGSGGNPFFVEEAARHLADSGPVDDGWHDASTMLRSRLGGLIVKRLHRLPWPVQQALAAAALIGQVFDTGAVAVVLRRQPEDVNELLRIAALDGLVRPDSSEFQRSESQRGDVDGNSRRYEFCHALVRDALYTGLPREQRSTWHRRMSMHLRDQPPTQVLEQLVHHLRRSATADADLAAAYSAQAGRLALDRHGYAEAAGHYQSALELVALVASDDELRRCRLLLCLGEARLAEYDLDASREAHLAATSLALQLSAVPELQQAVTGLIATTEFGEDDAAAAGIIERALKSPFTDQDVGLRANLLIALARVLPPTQARVQGLAAQAETLALQQADPRTRAVVALTALLVRWGSTSPARRRAVATECLVLAEDNHYDDLALEVRNVRAAAAEELGDMLGAAQDLSVLKTGAISTRRPFLLALSRMRSAGQALGQGRYAEGELLSAQALRHGQRSRNFIAAHLAQTFAAYRDQGRLVEIESTVAVVADQTCLPAWRAALALVHLERGRHQEAADELERLQADGFERLPADWLRLPTLAYLAEVSSGLRHGASAQVLYRLLTPESERNVVVAHGVLSLGAGARYLGLLAYSTGATDAAQLHFSRAEQLHRSWGLWPWLVRSQLGRADVLDARVPGCETAQALRTSATGTARELGMTAVL